MNRFIARFASRNSTSSVLAGIVAIAIAGYFMTLPQSAATMATFTVNSTLDLPDLNPGDGICNAGVALCTLRAAVMEANASSGPDTISLPAGTYTLTIGPSDDEFNFDGARDDIGDLDVLNDDLTITGAGAATTIIDGGGIDRIFDVNNFSAFGAGVNFTLNDVTLRNGNAPTSPEGYRQPGGAIQFDGSGATPTLTLHNCKLTNNTAAGIGGGVLALFGTMVVDGSEISSNRSLNGSGGGILYESGGSAGSRFLQVTNSTFSQNQAPNSSFGNGGAISTSGNANITIESNSFSGNTAGANGGAISADALLASNTKGINKNKFENNSAAQGGAVFNRNGTFTFSLNVVVGNSAADTSSTGFRQGTSSAAGSTATLVNNWWGCNQGPSVSPCDRVSGPVGFGSGPWLVLSHTATPNAILVNTATTLQADFFTPSSGAPLTGTDLVALNGRAIVFNNAVLGSISGADTQISGGKANATYTAGAVGGAGSADATVDHATVTANISITQAAGITCPGDIATTTEPGLCSASVTFAATATGFPAPTVTYTIGATVVTSPHTFPTGSTTVTATASNGPSGDATCSFTVTVTDDEPPSITCPSNISTTTNPATCGAMVTYDAPTGTDNCPGATTTQTAGLASGSTFPVGTTTNTFKVTDASGHETSCSFTVTVNDNEKPVVTVPANITVSAGAGQCDAVVTFSATATDNCPTGLNVVSSPASGSTFPKGTTTVTTTATDASGNTASKTFTVTVEDNEPPSITCPTNITTNVDAGSCGAMVTYTTPVGTDNCSGATTVQTSGLASGSTFPVGTTTNTFQVTDASGHQTSCSFTVTVVDNEAPSISCPANISTNADPGTCGAVVNYTAPVGSDNCPGATTMQTSGLPSGSTFPIGTTINTFRVTDASGTQTSCSFTVTVSDNQAPTITLNGQTPVLWPPDHTYRTINVTDLVASASDLCDAGVDINDVVIAHVSSDELEDGPADGSTVDDMVIAADCKSVQLRAERQASNNGRVYTITFRVRDASGNTATVAGQVIVPSTSATSGAVDGPGPGYTVTSGCP